MSHTRAAHRTLPAGCGWMRPRFHRSSLAHLVGDVDPRALAFQAASELRVWRRSLSAPNHLLPTALYLETSSYCEGACSGCYVPASDRKQHLRLDADTLHRVIAAAERLPIAYIGVVGGEPLAPSIVEDNLRLVRDHPRTRFVVCTSGDFEIGPELGRQMGALRNLSVLVSFDGLPSTHERIRPRGSFERACAALDAYRRFGRGLCGASVTLRPGNWREVTSKEFVDRLDAAGVHYLVYSPFETRAGEPALAPAHHALAVGRLAELSASSRALIFTYPFGQILGRRFALVPRLRSMSVDYTGNVYLARRGPCFGNVMESALDDLLARPAVQEAYARAARTSPLSSEARRPAASWLSTPPRLPTQAERHT